MFSSEENLILKDINNYINRPLNQIKQIKHATIGYLLDDQQITGLGLYNQNFTHLPDSIFSLKKLKILGLCDNKLALFHEDICKLTNLEILILRNNHIKTIPKSIEKLTKLKYLDIQNNQLQEIPNKIGFNTSALKAIKLT